MQRIAIVGSGYAGLCTAIAFAKLGDTVTCVDSDPEKVRQIWQGVPPSYEKGLRKELGRLRKEEQLTSTTDTTAAVGEAQTIFIRVGTPASKDGALDPPQVRSAAAPNDP